MENVQLTSAELKLLFRCLENELTHMITNNPWWREDRDKKFDKEIFEIATLGKKIELLAFGSSDIEDKYGYHFDSYLEDVKADKTNQEDI